MVKDVPTYIGDFNRPGLDSSFNPLPSLQDMHCIPNFGLPIVVMNDNQLPISIAEKSISFLNV